MGEKRAIVDILQLAERLLVSLTDCHSKRNFDR